LDTESVSSSDDEEDQEMDEDRIRSVRPKDLKWLQSEDFWSSTSPTCYTEDQKQSSMQKLVQIYKILKEINRVRIDQSKKEIEFHLDLYGPLFQALIKDDRMKATPTSIIREESEPEWLTIDQLRWLGYSQRSQ
jgi:hypothetical protein